MFSLLENIFVKLFVHLDIIQSLASHVEQFSNKCAEKSLTSFPWQAFLENYGKSPYCRGDTMCAYCFSEKALWHTLSVVS